MTAPEFNEMAALIVRLRTDLELHTDSLRQSNAQCGEYLRQNEQLHSELVEVRAALAAATTQRDSYKQTLDKWEREDTKPHACVTADDVADHVAPPVLNRGEPDPQMIGI
jgi:chromosome segregation ATPase